MRSRTVMPPTLLPTLTVHERLGVQRRKSP
jgi:hypothetical protein